MGKLQKSEYLKDQKSVLGEIKMNFHNFKGFLLVRYGKMWTKL